MKTSRVLYPPQRPALDFQAAKAAVTTFFENRRSSSKTAFYQERAMLLLHEVKRQLRRCTSLDLSDGMMRDRIDEDLTASQCRYLRVLMQKAGLVFVPEGKRSKKPGDYPQWLVRFTYFLKRTFTPKKSRKPSYQLLYYTIRKAVVDDLYQELEEYEISVTARTFWSRVNQEVTLALEELGLSREALKI